MCANTYLNNPRIEPLHAHMIAAPDVVQESSKELADQGPRLPSPETITISESITLRGKSPTVNLHGQRMTVIGIEC
jgi:hypothetical protein